MTITHDFMIVYGGAERVTQEIARAFPLAQVTAIVAQGTVAERMGVGDRYQSLLPARSSVLRHHRELAPVLPALVKASVLPEADVVLSSSYAFAHLFQTVNRAPHVCYCHSPLRFAWSMTESYRDVRTENPVGRVAFNTFARAMRSIDRRAARNVDLYLTQSRYVGDQIERFYDKPPTIVGAPVDCDMFAPDGRVADDYYLLCGRLTEPYKRMELVLRAFASRPDLRLVVAGDGPAMEAFRELASPNVEFLGHLDDSELVEAMQRCKAAIFPSRDDFGLIPVEVMACGRPVLAYGGGGARYTVLPGVTGELFDHQTEASFAVALRRFEPSDYDPRVIRDHALQWDSTRFRARLVKAVRSVAA